MSGDDDSPSLISTHLTPETASNDEELPLKRPNKNAPAVMRSDRPVKRLRLDPNLSLSNKFRDPR